MRARFTARSGMTLVPHVRFLQHVFRRVRARRPGAWVKGFLRGVLPVWRPVAQFRCQFGGLAVEAEFQEQEDRARGVVGWYACYVRVLTRMLGRTPGVVSGFCGGGGSDEGIRRAGASSHGVDLENQPDYAASFGREHFTQGDAREESVWKRASKLARAFLWTASPPCQPYSTGRLGEPSQPALIGEMRGLLQRSGKMFWMENVLGAAKAMSADSTILRGSQFGLRVDHLGRFAT